jgi:hypothetical protein
VRNAYLAFPSRSDHLMFPSQSLINVSCMCIKYSVLSDTSTRRMANNTSAAHATLQVVCAFPLSSNYGPGSRILYYVLVAACVTFRKAEWLRNTCLAAVLVLPAISALQGIVLASAHTNG